MLVLSGHTWGQKLCFNYFRLCKDYSDSKIHLFTKHSLAKLQHLITLERNPSSEGNFHCLQPSPGFVPQHFPQPKDAMRLCVWCDFSPRVPPWVSVCCSGDGLDEDLCSWSSAWFLQPGCIPGAGWGTRLLPLDQRLWGSLLVPWPLGSSIPQQV